MSDTFKLKVVTPQGVVCEEEVLSVTLPGRQGQMQVLPKHIGYTGLLATGILEYLPVDNGSGSKRVVIGKGFCNFLEEGLMILADSVDTPEGLVVESYAGDKEQLSKAVREGNAYEAAWQEARNKLDRIEAIESMLKH
jgi:F0F1-type ATP synthase epsilon subunit